MSTPLTPSAISYAWDQLKHRAGISGSLLGDSFRGLGVPVYYTLPGEVQRKGSNIIVVPCGDNTWYELLERAPDSLDWLAAQEAMPPESPLSFGNQVPILFWGEGYEDGHKPFAEIRSDGALIFYVDIIACTFFMLSRWEETVVPARDEHDRFPATASVAYRQGFLNRPIVDEYALILREWFKVLLPGWKPQVHQFSIRLECDVDAIRGFLSLSKTVRTFGGDLFKRRKPKEAWRTGLDFLVQAIAPNQTSYFRGISTLSKFSRQHGIDSAFYFMAAEPGLFDEGYSLTSPILKRCIKTLQNDGFEIGFHPGYHTLNDPKRLAAEKARFDAAVGIKHYGGRQHYLRFRVPNTWRHYDQLGLVFDSTVVYPDQEGFRCGTCHPFRPFDIAEDRQLALWERPVIVMDKTLHRCWTLTPEEGENRILKLAMRCKAVEGTFSLLWHNSSLDREWRPWAAMFHRVMARIQTDACL